MVSTVAYRDFLAFVVVEDVDVDVVVVELLISAFASVSALCATVSESTAVPNS